MSAERHRILLVEDNPSDAFLVRKALENAEVNFDLTLIEDGAEAMAFVRREGKYATAPTPDLAVLDLNLPKHDGSEILKEMRQSPLSNVPVVILTSSPSPSERQKLEAFHIMRYIIKPDNLKEFLQVGKLLRNVLSRGGR